MKGWDPSCLSEKKGHLLTAASEALPLAPGVNQQKTMGGGGPPGICSPSASLDQDMGELETDPHLETAKGQKPQTSCYGVMGDGDLREFLRALKGRRFPLCFN